MFIGHYAVAFGAKSLAPRTSLGTMILGALFIDLLWPTLVLLGWERVRIEAGATAAVPLIFEHYPYTHSLLAVVLWAVAVALIYQWQRHYLRGAMVVGGAVVSHWLLDLLVHIPDLPLTPWGNTLVGLGLWQSLWGSLLLELALFALGLWLYLRTTRAVDGIGRWALWGTVAFMILLFLGNTFGPPPPSATAIAWAGQAQWLFVAWGFWLERHRTCYRQLQSVEIGSLPNV